MNVYLTCLILYNNNLPHRGRGLFYIWYMGTCRPNEKKSLGPFLLKQKQKQNNNNNKTNKKTTKQTNKQIPKWVCLVFGVFLAKSLEMDTDFLNKKKKKKKKNTPG